MHATCQSHLTALVMFGEGYKFRSLGGGSGKYMYYFRESSAAVFGNPRLTKSAAFRDVVTSVRGLRNEN
jgi:hypothetical protein